MLSNTAVPKYYGAWRDAVLRGDIPVCREIAMEMDRIESLIADPAIYYDPEPVEAWISFCETELVLTDGSPMVLLDSFKVWGEQVWGWYYFVDKTLFIPNKDTPGGHYEIRKIKKRLINKQFLIVGRGAAKTVYQTAIHSHGLVCDPSATEQITTAPTIKQSEEVLETFKTAITVSRGPLFKMMTYGSINNTTGSRNMRAKLCSTKDGIKNFVSNSVLYPVPMSIDKIQGKRCKYATVDEWLSCDINEDVIGAIEQGASKNDNYLIVATSSEGTVRNGPGDTIKMELMSILKGEYYNPHVSIFWYKLDDISEVGNPEMWVKANPNIGFTVSYEAYQNDVERAEKAPATRNDIYAKRFGIPLEGYTYYFPYEETIPHKYREYWKMPCTLGIDLSQGDDFCAFTFLFPLGDGTFGVKTRNYISSLTYEQLSLAMRQKYQEFILEGSLFVLDGTILDMMVVYEDIYAHIAERQYNVVAVGYDAYNAREFIERWITENSAWNVDQVKQGAKTESVPLGELKKLSEARMLLFDEQLMSFTMGNCIAKTDNNGNRMLYKRKREQKIDAVSALLDAFVVYKWHSDCFD